MTVVTFSKRALYLNLYGLETMAHLIDQTRYHAPDENGEVEVRLDTNELIDGPAAQRDSGAVRRRQRVGEILSLYYRSAA